MRSGNRIRRELIGRNWLRLALLATVGLAMLAFFAPRRARAADDTTLHVVVTDAADGTPIYQAHLTLQFKISQRYRQDKWISYSAKTDKQGRCIFHHITKGPIRLLVTAEDHQSFGKDFKIEKDNPVIEVKLRKPQPQV
jgi:hypothetical protein